MELLDYDTEFTLFRCEQADHLYFHDFKCQTLILIDPKLNITYVAPVNSSLVKDIEKNDNIIYYDGCIFDILDKDITNITHTINKMVVFK